MSESSLASLTALSSSIARDSASSSGEVDLLATSLEPSSPHRQPLQLLSASLHNLETAVTQVGEAFISSSPVSEELRSLAHGALTLASSLAGARRKQLLRVQEDSVGAVDIAYLVAHKEAVDAQRHMFNLIDALLQRTTGGEPDKAIAAPAAQHTIEQMDAACRLAARKIDIMKESDDSSDMGSASTSKGARGSSSSHFPPEDGDQLPPYSSSQTIHPAEQAHRRGSSSTASTLGTSLTKSIKAVASVFRPKPDPLVSALCKAASRDDTLHMVGLLSQGANANGKNEDGNTALQCAIKSDHENAARLLLASGAHYEGAGWSGLPPLFLAASLGSLQVAELLINKGADVNQRSMSGQPYFADVVTSGNMEGVRFLLKRGASSQSRFVSGQLVIAHAVKKGNLELTALLLEHGAETNSADVAGSHLLAMAVGQENLPLVDLLLAKGADANSRSYTGACCLMLAIGQKQLDLVQRLIHYGADANAKDIYGNHVLISVIKSAKLTNSEKVQVARLLLEHGARTDAADVAWGIVAICHAMDAHMTGLVRLLLEYGANLEKVKMSSGEPLLLFALDTGRHEEVKLLITHGADPNEADKRGRTPMMAALARKDFDTVKLLLEHGANKETCRAAIEEYAAALGRPELLVTLGLAGPVEAPPESGAPPSYEAAVERS